MNPFTESRKYRSVQRCRILVKSVVSNKGTLFNAGRSFWFCLGEAGVVNGRWCGVVSGVIWCGMVWYIYYGVILYGMVWYGMAITHLAMSRVATTELSLSQFLYVYIIVAYLDSRSPEIECCYINEVIFIYRYVITVSALTPGWWPY